jgi:hypothetical protein
VVDRWLVGGQLRAPQRASISVEVHGLPKIAGFRLGIYVFKDAEIVDFAAPYGMF